MYKGQYLIIVKKVDMKCGVRFVQIYNMSTSESLLKNRLFFQNFHPSTRTDQTALLRHRSAERTQTPTRGWRNAEYRQLSDADIMAIFPLFLKDSAIDWFYTLSTDFKSNLESRFKKNYKSYFGKSYFGKKALGFVFTVETVFKSQREGSRLHLENAEAGETSPTSSRPKPHCVRASIIAQKGDIKSVADILQFAKVAESAGVGKDDDSFDATKINQLMQGLCWRTRSQTPATSFA